VDVWSRRVSPVRKVPSDLVAIFRIAGARVLVMYLVQIAKHLPDILRSHTLRAADDGMSGKVYTFRVLGKQVRLKGSEFGLAREIYGRGVYFRPPEVILEARDIVVDVGANVGVFTALASVVGARVISVEAQSEFVNQIYDNATRNGARDRVEVEFGLIGAESGAFSDPSVLHSASHFGAEPPTLTMPDLMRRHALDHIDFLKVDIEGSEFALFEGGSEWLTSVDKMAMEVHPEFGDTDHLVKILQGSGFQVDSFDYDRRAQSRAPQETRYILARRSYPAERLCTASDRF